jgi:RNA polymerase sigma-70 factor (ECF subfamily)
MGIHAQTPDAAALVLEKVEAEQVHQAIATLPEDYRIVATLYFMEEFAYQEIAAILGCPVGTVRSRLHRGRRMLQKALWDMAEQQGIVAALRSTEASSGS